MKRSLTLLIMELLLSSLNTAGADNLLVDGRFEASRDGFLEFWSVSSAKNVRYDPVGGPEGEKPSMGLRGDGATCTVTVRQHDLTLVPGETYKLSGYVRTKDFQCRGGGAIVINAGWRASAGLQNFPANSDWTFMEKTFTLFPSEDEQYGVVLYAINPTGEIHFAELKLEALTEAARKGSRSGLWMTTVPRLVPFVPKLNRIPHSHPELTLQFYGQLPEPREAYDCVVTVDEDRIPRQTLPLEDGKVVVSLVGLSPGHTSLEAVVCHRDTGESVLQAEYAVGIVDLPHIDRRNIRPRNNLVAELLNEPVPSDPKPLDLSFVNPRDGWVFVALTGAQPAPTLTVRIDDRDTVITAATDRLEAFREMGMGEHRICVAGAGAGARLIVRSVPEIFNYPPCTNSFVAENGNYDWAFMKKHILHAVTTLNGGRLPGDALPEAKARGLKWLANFGVAPLNDPAEIRERMERHAGMTEPQYDGLTSDELFFNRMTIDHYTRALWRLSNPEDRLVYTWIVGKPSISALHTDFLSACLNASKGRGRLLFEAYCHPQADEEAAAAYLDDKMVDTIRRFNAFFPNAVEGAGIIFGNFNQIPIISLEHDPAVDFKYYLDMQVNLVANHPDFAGLATTGYWGTYYADEELVRWAFQLMRHYAVEGKTEMLSTRHGFTYKPGFLANGDFVNGLAGWTVSPAAEDTVRTATIDGYGEQSQGRWGAGKAGDTVCLMTRRDGKPNRIHQTAKGLEVAKVYCLQFVTADYDDVVGRKYNPRRYGIDVELEGAEILPDRSFVHIDRRKTHPRHDPGCVGKITLNRVIFRARSTTQGVAFHDKRAVPGETLAVNFVQLKPYFE